MRASRLKRSAARAVRPSSGGSTLSATRRRSPTSVALNTTAIPPRASSCSTSYSPASTIRSRELVAPSLDHNAERHRAIAAEDRVANVGDRYGLRAGRAEDVREPARQRGRPHHHYQGEPYRRTWGSRHGTPASKGSLHIWS